MTSVLRRANEQSQSEWRNVDEGLWRWRIAGKPEVALSEKFGKYQVKFTLLLTKSEQDRLLAELADNSPESLETIKGGQVQQSFRSSYRVGLSLGWVDRDGTYKTTKLIDFLAACLGQPQTKKFREWIAQGGGPPRPDDLNDAKAELEAIVDWLGWWEDLEVYGTITHREGDRGVFANFAVPMPVGSLPGHKDPDYDALGRGKLRAIIAESGETRTSNAQATNGKDDPPIRYTQQGEPVVTEGAETDPLNELPF
jgi:hypothetical protein